jgi:hypothetical protein
MGMITPAVEISSQRVRIVRIATLVLVEVYRRVFAHLAGVAAVDAAGIVVCTIGVSVAWTVFRTSNRRFVG